MFGFFKKKLTRKERSEKFLESHGVKINYHLPHVESEEETVLRTPEEIATRVTALAFVNMVACNAVDAEKCIETLHKFKLYDALTPNEKDFLSDPTEERKNTESWKCECIWVLLWALNKVDDLGYPDELCNLNNTTEGGYPLKSNVNPNDYIKSITTSRNKTEILDANDLYYRLDWACVDARINGREIDGLIPGVVYERHYALNWLINYMDDEWDDISCDT
ncbi:MAG: DUF4272 domain-containing protein [Flavobacteriales bacterium]|nr:DUF4272 domain-containing protein [Flavobacteriales bacterium]